MIPYGEKTYSPYSNAVALFESSVIPYGEKTVKDYMFTCEMFESSVIPYGEKTRVQGFIYNAGLRVV